MEKHTKLTQKFAVTLLARAVLVGIGAVALLQHHSAMRLPVSNTGPTLPPALPLSPLQARLVAGAECAAGQLLQCVVLRSLVPE